MTLDHKGEPGPHLCEKGPPSHYAWSACLRFALRAQGPAVALRDSCSRVRPFIYRKGSALSGREGEPTAEPYPFIHMRKLMELEWILRTQAQRGALQGLKLGDQRLFFLLSSMQLFSGL